MVRTVGIGQQDFADIRRDDLFYIDNKGKNTLRLGLSRLSDMDIEKGIKIIGETIDELNINA